MIPPWIEGDTFYVHVAYILYVLVAGRDERTQYRKTGLQTFLVFGLGRRRRGMRCMPNFESSWMFLFTFCFVLGWKVGITFDLHIFLLMGLPFVLRDYASSFFFLAGWLASDVLPSCPTIFQREGFRRPLYSLRSLSMMTGFPLCSSHAGNLVILILNRLRTESLAVVLFYFFFFFFGK